MFQSEEKEGQDVTQFMQTMTNVGTDILDEFGSGENQRFMMEKEVL